MIFKFALPEYKSFVTIPFKAGAIGAVVMAPLCYFTDTHIVDGSIAYQFAIDALVYFIVGAVVPWIVMEVQFWKRNDNFIFQGYFSLYFELAEISDIEKTLEKLGYKKIDSENPHLTMKREFWPGKDFTKNSLDFRPYFVDVVPQDNQILLKFVVREWEHQFDGKQIAFKAAEEFRRSFTSN